MTGHNPAQQIQAFRLPDVGEGLTEAEIVAWHVSTGDAVAVNQVLVEIETAKSIVELPSPFEGTVVALLAAVGDTVPVGEAIIEVSAANTQGAETQPPAGSTHIEPEAREENAPKLLVGYGASDPGHSRRRRRARSGSSASPTAAASTPLSEPRSSTATTGGGSAKPQAKPPVRGLARRLGVDLTRVTPTGPNGTISRDDVSRASEHASDTHRPTPDTAGTTRIPIKGVRKATAAAMVQSAFTAPHVTEFITIDVTRSLELIEEIRQRREFRDLKLTPLSLVARAYLLAISRTPMAAAHWSEESAEIVVPGTVNLGIAAATPRGLLVPNIKNAGALGLAELAQAIGALAETARSGKTPPADLAGGATTITNVGVFGVDTGTPILNPGETAILAVGAIQRRPWVVGTGDAERIEPRSIMQLALSFDHRVLDGAEGSRLLADTAAVLENPGLALL